MSPLLLSSLAFDGRGGVDSDGDVEVPDSDGDVEVPVPVLCLHRRGGTGTNRTLV